MRAVFFIGALAVCVASVTAFCVSPHASLFTTSSKLKAVATRKSQRVGSGGVVMKRKGKPNIPMDQRGDYNLRRQQEAAYAEQNRQLESGMPAFEIYVRTNMNNMWYPCGGLMGDEKAKATVDAMMGGFLSGVSKYTLEKGVASSVIQKRGDLVKQVVMRYPQLKNTNLTFGFKIIYNGLEEKLGPQEITEITKDMTLGPIETMKKKLGW